MTNESPLPPWRWGEELWRPLVDRVRAGRRLAPKSWPGGARCAVALSFDCDHETFELGAGGQAMGRMAWGEFGRRVGVPRVLATLRRHDVRATFFVPAVCTLIDPDEPKRIVADGHEIGLHGWIHENLSLLSKEEERDILLRSRDRLDATSGVAPVGHRGSHWDLSRNTIALVRDLGLRYDSSMMADEECYELVVDGAATGVVEVPVEWLRDDAPYFLFNRNPATRPYTPPREVFEIFRREFDQAYEEESLFQLVMHPFVIGYRSRLWILDELIRHAKSRPGVWFGTHADVADWAMNSESKPGQRI